MGEKKTVNVLVTGGEANAGPPLGPALGPLGVNVMNIVQKINELTKDYSGMRAPVKVTVDQETKEFDVEVGIPTTSALIIKESGVPKGSGTPNENFVGNLSFEQVLKIADIKKQKSYAYTTKSAVREVIGSCISIGMTVENKDPREIQREITDGKWADKIKE